MRRQAVRGIVSAAAAVAAFLAVYLLGKYVSARCGGIYTFDWTVRRGLFHAAALMTVIPSAFGRYRFSCCAFTGNLLGLAAGELLGADPSGAAFGQGHLGWFIWCAVFTVSMAAGVAAEILAARAKRRNAQPESPEPGSDTRTERENGGRT